MFVCRGHGARLCFCLPCVIRLLAALHDPQHGRGATQRDLDKLPTCPFSADLDLLKGEEPCCPVCICDYEENDRLRVLPCSHAPRGLRGPVARGQRDVSLVPEVDLRARQRRGITDAGRKLNVTLITPRRRINISGATRVSPDPTSVIMTRTPSTCRTYRRRGPSQYFRDRTCQACVGALASRPSTRHSTRTRHPA